MADPIWLGVVFLILGLFLLVGGIVGRVVVGRGAFYRRNSARVEQFRSYGAAVATQGSEGCLRVIFTVAIVFGALWLVGGIFAFLTTGLSRVLNS